MRLFMVILSVCVSITLFSNTGSMNGAISGGVHHEAFCQLYFCFMDDFQKKIAFAVLLCYAVFVPCCTNLFYEHRGNWRLAALFICCVVVIKSIFNTKG